MNSSIAQSAAWLIGPDLDPPWHTISEWARLRVARNRSAVMGGPIAATTTITRPLVISSG